MYRNDMKNTIHCKHSPSEIEDLTLKGAGIKSG